MAHILLLVHRLPYPPDKGDKVRSYHLLRHLLQRHRVFLGTFIDDPDDARHLDALRAICPDLHAVSLDPRWRKPLSATGFLTGEPLTLAYYRHAGLQQWVRRVVAEHGIDASVVFSSSMALYAMPLVPRVPMLVDFVDVDSAKWAQYAPAHRWPMSWVYRREARRLLAFERSVAARAERAFFVTEAEVALFNAHAPETRDRVQALGNGVDATTFAPDPARASPFAPDELPLVFTGAMDYWPNVDAVTWFAREVLPRVRERWPSARLHVVGRSPTPAVRALAGPDVSVTGTVPDVRPYLQHAAAVVAPLRVARGIQNKILEAMAMQQPVVTVSGCADVIGADAAQGLLRADDPPAMAAAVGDLLADRARSAALGAEARAFVLRHFSWTAQLAGLDAWLDGAVHRRGEPAAAPVEVAHG